MKTFRRVLKKTTRVFIFAVDLIQLLLSKMHQFENKINNRNLIILIKVIPIVI